MNQVWQDKLTKGSERLVLLSLADNANDEGYCWPSHQTIAEKCNLSRRFIIKIIKSLEFKNLVVSENRILDGKKTSNIYRLIVNPSSLPSEPQFTTLVNPSSHKPSLNHQLTINEEEGENTKNIYRSYEAEIGLITKAIADCLSSASEDYPESWIISAIEVASRNNARSWSYIDAILKRWKVEGFKSKSKSKNKSKESYQDTIDNLARKRGIQINKVEGDIIDV